MLKKITLATALLAFMGSANAYQFEIGGSYDRYDYDNDHSNWQQNSKIFNIDGTYHFKPVDTSKGPLNEATFINHSSNLKLNFIKSEHDGYSEWDETAYIAGIEYFLDNSNLYFSANIGHTKQDDDYGWDYSYTSYSGELGFLATPTLLLAVGFEGYDSSDNDSETDPTFRVKYLTKLNKYDVNFEAKAVGGDETFFSVGTDIYLDKTLSVGATYTDGGRAYWSSDNVDILSLKAKKFVSPQLSVEAHADFGDYIKEYGARIAYRF